MFSRPKGSLSRILLVACAVGLGSSSFYGQNSTPPPAAPMAAPISKIDVFMGYSYLAPHGYIYTPLPDGSTVPATYSSINYGAILSGAYYFNKYVGGQLEGGFHPSGNNDGAYTMSAGIIARYPTDAGITPFAHALAGGVHLGGPNAEPLYSHPYTWGPVLTVGGGMDYGLPFFDHHLALRLFQADYEYMHASYGPQAVTGGRANLNNARLSTGIVLKFGSIIPPPPVTYSCAVNPSAVFPGDPITVTGTALNLNPKKPATYTWSGTGVKVTGDSTTGNIDTTGLSAGSYTVTGHVSEGQKPGEFADCTANFTVKPYEPPTLSCSADPSSVPASGGTSTITATGVSPQNRPLTYSFTSSAGQISGTGNTATLNTTGAPAGAITVTGNVSDDKGQTASCTATVTVQPAPPAPAKTSTLCTISFGRDTKRPARVDNEAKACLDQVALSAQQTPDATITVVGEAGPAPAPKKGHKAVVVDNLAAQRAVNTKAYLVTEKGIDASRVSVRTGTQSVDEVENYLVPAGASFDSDVPGTTAVDESTVKAQARTPLGAKPAAHHHKKAAAAPAP